MDAKDADFPKRIRANVAALLAVQSEPEAADLLERLRWPGDPGCLHCGSENTYRPSDRKGARAKGFPWRCRACARRFSVRTGTPLDGGRMPLDQLCRALAAVVENPADVDGALSRAGLDSATVARNRDALVELVHGDVRESAARKRGALVAAVVLALALLCFAVARASLAIEPAFAAAPVASDVLHSDWTSSGEPCLLQTTREPGESDAQLRERHLAALSAFKARMPPD